MLERSLVISSVIDLLANCCLSLRSARGPTRELRHVVLIQHNRGGDTFPQGVCLTEQVSWSAEMGRGSSVKGLTVGAGSSLPKMTTPALPARLHLPRPH